MTDSSARFLIVRLSSIGDIVHALPAASALAESFPSAQIDWVVEKRHAVLLEGNPYLRRIVVIDTLGWRQGLASFTTWREIRKGVSELRQRPYSAAFDFQGLWKSAVIARLSGAQQRVGFGERWLREPAAAILYTQQVSPPERAHVIEENLALVEHVGARTRQWRFPLPQSGKDDAYVDAQLTAMRAGNFVILNPGGGWRSKCWSPQNYAALIRQMSELWRQHILLTGSPAEEPVICEILQNAGTRLARYFPATLVQFIALARRAQLFIGGDTGPLHLAAAVGTPVVGIYGPTNPARNGPFAADDIALSNGSRIDHTRRAPNPEYLPGIPIDLVLEAVNKRLSRVHG
jgi:heptosyltransferase-1